MRAAKTGFSSPCDVLRECATDAAGEFDVMPKKRKSRKPVVPRTPQPKPRRLRFQSLVDAINVFRFDKKKRSAFCVNILVGIATLLFFKFTEQSRWWDNIGNSGFDTLIYLESKEFAQKENQLEDSPVFFIEIDGASYAAWRRSYPAAAGAALPLPPEIKNACSELPFTPRAQLGRLIDKAWKANAALVLLDVVLDTPDPCDPEGDKELRKVLGNMQAANASTHVAFPALTAHDGRLKRTIVDDLIDKPDAPRILHRHSPQIVGSSIDSVYRFWSMFLLAHNEQGKRILWSSPVLASAIAQNRLAELDQLSESLLRVMVSGEPSPRTFGLPIDEHIRFSLTATRQNAPDKTGAPASPVSLTAPERQDFQRVRFRLTPSTSSTLFLKQSAEKFLNASKEDHGQDLKGKVVLIGATSRDKDDHHITPAGEFPGVYILGNAIFSILKGLTPRHLSAVRHYAIECFVILVAAYVFLYFKAGRAALLSKLLFLLLFAPISWVLFIKYGVFFNFIAPMVGMGLHKSFAGIEALIMKHTKHGAQHE
jgi:CHASE2 domain-containing sensor protein